jgi:tetratricopeptide (TPR) repeat protein
VSESAGAAAPGEKRAEETVWMPAPDPDAESGVFPRDMAAEAAAAILEAGEFEDPAGADAQDAEEPDQTHVALTLPTPTPMPMPPPTTTPPPPPTPPATASVTWTPPPVAPPASAPSAEQVARHIARAEALAELGRRQQALDVLNELIVAGAEDVRIWRSLAQIHLELGDGEKALRAADWVVTFQPDDEWGHRLRSAALKLLQRPEEAVAAASEAVKLGPAVWQGQAALAMALHSTGDLSAAAEAARKATVLAAEVDPGVDPEAKQVAEALQAAVSADSEAQAVAGAAGEAAEPVLDSEIKLLEGLESAVAGSPDGLDEESLQHVGNLVLRALEFSAGAGWLVSFGGIAIPSFNLRVLIPVAVLVVLAAFLFGPARKAGRDIWRYLIEYLWQDAKTRSALIMAVAAHVWMIAGSSVGHVQGGSALTIGLITHLAGRSVLAKKAPELNPVRRTPSKGAEAAGAGPDVTSAPA